MVVDKDQHTDPMTDTHHSSISVHFQLGSPAPILNYVHQSSNVLRKVRLGQPLEAALHSKPLLKVRRKQHQELANFKQGLVTVGSPPINFRREPGLQPLSGLQVSHHRQPPHSSSPPICRNIPRYLLPFDARTPMKTYTNLGYEQNTVPNDEKMSYDTSTYLSTSPDQHNAALIIARFFRSVCRLDNAADRTREILRRRWRDQHPEKYRTPLFKLTNNEQLRVLQLYNPHLYGSQTATSPIASTSTSVRMSGVPQMEQHKRLRQLQILARMNKETELLNETSRQKTKTPISAVSTLHEAYQRQSFASHERTQNVLSRERLQQTHDLVTFSKTPPNFRYKTTPQSHLLVAHTLKSVSTLEPLIRSVNNK